MEQKRRKCGASLHLGRAFNDRQPVSVGCVGSEVVKSVEYLFVSSGSDHPSSAEELGCLYGQLSRDSGCTKDEHSLTHSELSTPSKCPPGRQTGVYDGCGDIVVNVI